ncbi:MAG: hypothetical protein KAR42_01720 [candidate division Zixibacteria bacterium]|nr:hypothetical protein [candidate division Zixibacteria bacterium]
MAENNNEYRNGNEDVNQKSVWVVIAECTQRMEAEFAVNGLKSYEIPVVLDASPGVLGTAGLPLTYMYSGKSETFKIKVPAEYEEEAREAVKVFIGSKNKDNSQDFAPED